MKRLSILLVFSCLQFEIQYVLFVLNIKRQYYAACASYSKKYDNYTRLEKEVSYLKNRVLALTFLKKQRDSSVATKDRAFILFNILQRLNLLRKEITYDKNNIFHISAEGRYENFLTVLNEFSRTKSIIITNFLLQKINSRLDLVILISVILL
jgi:hypothetical protein